MSEQKNDDLGKISLWLSDGGKTLASGKIQLFEQDGSVTSLNVYIYENNQKKNDSSPDYFGFIKQPQKKGIVKKSYTSTEHGERPYPQNHNRFPAQSNEVSTEDDDDTIAF